MNKQDQKNKDVDRLCIDTVRFLAVDAVEKADSGHPGTPLGATPMVYTIWDRHLRHNPKNPSWPGRDRFILSCGHASAMLYAMLHMTGYDLPLEEIRNFRQWWSQTPGHPEYGLTTGVEVTTGPLGQGFSNGVGMAIAAQWLSANFYVDGLNLFDNYIYALTSDGDMMEGIASESASLAGHLGLGRLIYLYDSNQITIEGDTDLAFTEDVGKRFEAYGWHVQGAFDANDLNAIDEAIKKAKEVKDRPSLIICSSKIGYGSPVEGHADAHGKPLGEEGVKATKEKLDWPEKPKFHIPEEAVEHFGGHVIRGKDFEKDWNLKMTVYKKRYPEKAAELERFLAGELPYGWDEELKDMFTNVNEPVATRSASGKALNRIAKKVGNLMGGSADLAGSNKTLLDGEEDFEKGNYSARNMHFGVREHAMAGILSGMALHGGVIPYGGTFLTFSDYMRPSIRLAALMGVKVIYVFTHDSIGLGEDGPTHQPIEHLMSLRTIPNLTLIRPSDATETVEAWKAAMAADGPVALALTRQKLPVRNRKKYASASGLQKGAYILWESGEEEPAVILIGTGSETGIALRAGEKLAESGVDVRVVSMPSWELFEKQPQDYRDGILPPRIKARVAVEAGQKIGWERYVGLDGAVVGLDDFGASAPFEVLYEKYGITVSNVVAHAWETIESLKNKAFVS